MKKVSLMDVAAAAGVSHTTVAHVINGGPVSEETRELVEAKIRQLGYIPNRMASALKSSRSGILGSLFVHNAGGLIHKINESIIDAARKADYELIVMETHWGEEEQTINRMLSLQIDGLVIISDLFVPLETLSQLAALHVPVVAVERGYAHESVDNLLVTDYASCYYVGRRMAESGHRHVAFVGSREAFGPVCDTALDIEYQRRTGFEDAARDHAMKLEKYVMEDYLPSEGYMAAEKILALPNRPTAVFCSADPLAAGVLQCLYAHRLRVPEDISVVGYDNVISTYLSPAVDSVALVYDGIGKSVMTMLTERMRDPDRTPQTMQIETAYIDRGTLKPI